ncbi:diacylglycerol kinase family lipid kinase [Haloechinothrix sp. LS1_15]|uniref:diacylglycerol/lipid kinase family protein n=1 Tax=Haloechinothrix sp. LS1_15 TaxID=2652248 RepID=UPI002946EF09|nr:diacylglycerol kinase family lipid kinase [Haloechinothrix sp. LS1_15]MDV6012530.1 diacylglycerol kinase family lipid kinase [Haloechinothrix sp. LS1_15]
MRRYTALVNPIAGDGDAERRLRSVAELLEQDGARVTVEETRSREHAIGLAENAASRGDVVIAVGGDGLIRDVAGGVVTTGGTLGIVPAGRGNDLARVLELPHEPAELARLLREAPARSIDVLEAGGVIVPGNVYAGIDAVATSIINRSRWMPAALLYRLAPVRAIVTWRARRYTVTADGDTRTVTAHTVVIGNSGAYGHGLAIVPQARLDDGVGNLLIVGDGPRRQIVSFLRQAATGAHVHRDDVTHETVREVLLDAERPVPLCADGDEIGSLPVRVRLLPGALDVIAPAPGRSGT